MHFAQRQSSAANRSPVLKHLLYTLFKTLSTRQRVLLVLPISVDMENEANFNKFFERVPLRSDELPNPRDRRRFASNQALFEQFAVYQSTQSEHIPAVHVRRARVEDHDDLAPILDRQNDSLVNAFGAYFLAELIHGQNEHNACLVAQGHDTDRAAGILSISEEIDVSSLQESFDLVPYNNLAKSSISSVHAGKISPPQIVICGPPAGGKGTQCELLVEEFGVIHLSTGDMLRAAIQADSPLGLQAKSFMDTGELVPDELIINVIIERLQQSDCQAHGWLLDGFPRTASQAQAMIQQGILPDAVVVLEVPDEEVVKRISGRRIDPETGKTYHLEFNPPPADEALLARLIQRSDDTESTILNRLTKFHENCDAVVDSFHACAKTLRVNGMQNKQTIAQYVCEEIQALKNAQKFRVLVRKQRLEPPKLIITGPPAGGKGTQCEVLVEHFDVVHLSTGDMLRASIQAGAPLGLKAKSFMDAGELVPDELIIDVILERLQQPDCKSRGWLLDGFPRTATQAAAMLEQGIVPHCVLVLEVPDEEVIKRISGRRVDPVTNKTYHVDFNPPPPDVRSRVIQRSDDNEDTIRNRLEKFHENSDSVIDTFAVKEVVQIVRCDGMQPKAATIQAFTSPIYQRMYDLEMALQSSGGGLAELDTQEAKANCFAITLFCMDVKYDVGAVDLLVNAFAVFPDKDFCLLTLPTTTLEPSFLNLFTLVRSKPMSTFTHVLYVLPRDVISFFHPTSEGTEILKPLVLRVERYLGPATDAELTALLAGVDAPTRNGVVSDLVEAQEENDIELAENPKNVVFAVLANAVMVGVVTLTRNHDFASALKNHFNIESVLLTSYHRSKDQAIIHHFVLNPILFACVRYVLEEIMREFKKSCVFYKAPIQATAGKPRPISPLVHELVLAPPRRSIAISSEEVAQYPDDTEKIKSDASYDEFALFVISKKLLTEPKLVVNSRVVLIGASDTAFTCLQRLLSVPYLRFTNVTLISPLGLEFAELPLADPLASSDSLVVAEPGLALPSAAPHVNDFAKKSLLTKRDIEQYSLRTHIRVIESRVVQIDREARAVILMDGSCLPYDYLSLATGLQDGTCTALGRFPTFDGDAYIGPATPAHMVVLSDLTAAKGLHNQLLNESDEHRATKIVVYGHSLLALQVIQGLLLRGIDGSRIVLMSPARGSIFEDNAVRAEVDKELAARGISVQYHTKIVGLTVDGHSNALTGVQITSTSPQATSHPDHHGNPHATVSHQQPPQHGAAAHHAPAHPTSHPGAHGHSADPNTVSCGWLLCCQHNDADYDIFRAINESGLVYDGRLVVNGHMRTTDPHILAAGSLCRFSRRFINTKLQEHYSPIECGELLATSLLQLVDPLASAKIPLNVSRPGSPATGESHDHQHQPSHGKLKSRKSMSTLAGPSTISHHQQGAGGNVANVVAPPEMSMPVIRTAVIVGGRSYVQISVPSLTNILSLQPLPTTTPERYTCLSFDDIGHLSRFEYLGRAPVEISNLQCVVGMHESFLNSALASFANGYVTDWVAYFHAKWATALYHDRFHDFRLRLNGFLKQDDGVRRLVEDIGVFFQETGDLKGAAAMAHVRVGRAGDALLPSTKKLIESQLLDFLSSNRDILNMYLLPRSNAKKH